MNPIRLLNFSTHDGDTELFENDWNRTTSFVKGHGFDGIELLPVGNYPFERIPSELIYSIHLRFFIFLRNMWRQDTKALERQFGSMENVQLFYGSRDRQCIVNTYVTQLDLAKTLGCRTVVFHPAQCDLDHVYDWQFPWHWKETIDICAEILNQALKKSRYTGWLLFENLWWPGSFRLDHAEEYEYLRRKMDYDRCGIVLDTGHMLNSSGSVNVSEPDAIGYLISRARKMGELKHEIRALHLTCSLSGEYIRESREKKPPLNPEEDFWARLSAARRHVGRIDPHDPFTLPEIGTFVEMIQPEQVVFEFSFRDIPTWEQKIRLQKTALDRVLWAHG